VKLVWGPGGVGANPPEALSFGVFIVKLVWGPGGVGANLPVALSFGVFIVKLVCANPRAPETIINTDTTVPMARRLPSLPLAEEHFLTWPKFLSPCPPDSQLVRVADDQYWFHD
jgi:hypothetical protein